MSGTDDCSARISDVFETGRRKTVLIMLFDGAEALDTYGTLEVLGTDFDLYFATRDGGPVQLNIGLNKVNKIYPRNPTCSEKELEQKFTIADAAAWNEKWDIMLIPGGVGTRKLCKDQEFLGFVQKISDNSLVTASVCSGASVLASAGILEGRKATTNKAAFDLVVDDAGPAGKKVDWVYHARWVTDNKDGKLVVTSSGVSAGMDMAMWLVEHFFGSFVAKRAGVFLEFTPQKDPSTDSFAEFWGDAIKANHVMLGHKTSRFSHESDHS